MVGGGGTLGFALTRSVVTLIDVFPFLACSPSGTWMEWDYLTVKDSPNR